MVEKGMIDPGRLTISKNNVRQLCPEAGLVHLILSIKTLGEVRSPVVINTRYEVVAGGRRWRASLEVGLRKIPYEMREYKNDAEELLDSLIENELHEPLQRDETINAVLKLAECGMALEDIGYPLGYTKEGIIALAESRNRPQPLTWEEIEKLKQEREGKKDVDSSQTALFADKTIEKETKKEKEIEKKDDVIVQWFRIRESLFEKFRRTYKKSRKFSDRNQAIEEAIHLFLNKWKR